MIIVFLVDYSKFSASCIFEKGGLGPDCRMERSDGSGIIAYIVSLILFLDSVQDEKSLLSRGSKSSS